MRNSFSLIFLSFCYLLLTIDCKKLKIDVFVESLCPYCNNFIKNSFKKFTENKNFQNLADIKFYSYGNAAEELKGETYTFKCQHGENECYGNILQNCAQKHLKQEKFFASLICIEENLHALKKDFDKLADKCILDEDLLKETKECLKGKEGNELHHLAAKETPANKQYVPWIVVEGEHKDFVENEILSDLNVYLCNLNDNNKDLDGCKEFIKKKHLN